MSTSTRPLVFQNDHSILLEVESARFDVVRDLLRQFAELHQAAGPFHVYRITDLSLWSAAASGLTSSDVVSTLRLHGQNVPPASLLARIQQVMNRYGLLRLTGSTESLHLASSDSALLWHLATELGLPIDDEGPFVSPAQRGWVKAKLAALGYPLIDEAALVHASTIPFQLSCTVDLRSYQQNAVRAFVEQKSSGGVILLPCGAGKTVVGVAIAATLDARTLVITPSRTIGDQWGQHFRAMTTIASDSVSIYRRGVDPTPVTVATYQALTARGGGAPNGIGEILDMPWGLIIYDEAHTLPADVFRQSASVQSVRRLGLTATLVREDGKEREVFSLVGPTVFSMPWRELERNGWIAPVDCVEVRINVRRDRGLTEDRMLASKLKVLRRILSRHRDDRILIVAHRLKEVAAAARVGDAEMITGQMTAVRRRELYRAFRAGDINRLALSRVANVGVDLPDASVLVQLSGAFGSRQEEAQRVGRVLRPKSSGRRATFYSLVIAGTREVEFAARRQRFLVDQGYRYRVLDVDPE